MGFGFGMSSGVITTLGIIIGLYSIGSSMKIILGGIISVAIADAFSDSLAMHLSEEAVKVSQKGVRQATIWTFFSKLFFALTFVIPFLMFSINISIGICIIYGLFLIGFYSYKISIIRKRNSVKVILEHIIITIIVILIVYFVKDLVRIIS